MCISEGDSLMIMKCQRACIVNILNTAYIV